MLERLKNREIGRCIRVALTLDVAIGLTEGWVAGIARGEKVRIIGSYVQSPLRMALEIANQGWAISTGPESKYDSIPDLKGSPIGISRIGRFVGVFVVDISGSYVMPYVLADQNSWLDKGKDPFDFKVLNTFENMINSVRFVL